MSFNAQSAGSSKSVLLLEETYTLPSSATTEYSSVIDIQPDLRNNNRYVTFAFNASAVSGTNLDIALYGSDDSSGTSKFLLKDAVVPDITATGWTAKPIDLNLYPASYYFIAWTSDVDESANTIDVKVFVPTV